MTDRDAARSLSSAPPFRHWPLWFVPPLIVVLILDQLTKSWVFAQQRYTLPFWILPDQNTGVAWSIGNSQPMLVALVTLVLIPALGLVWWLNFRKNGALENFAFGVILGGALGNGIDRAAARLGKLGGVRDFIHVDLGFWPAHPWPTFNIADAGITCGFLILVALSFRKPRTVSVPAASPVSDR